MDIKALTLTWCEFTWSDWTPFTPLITARAQLSTSGGIYRIKPVGKNNLVYLGQTNNLRRRLANELVPNTLSEFMPFNDPHTAAQSLWTWKVESGWTFELSVMETDLPTRFREGLECYLLWQYRMEAGQSTLCNHGRFHPNYMRSGDRKSGKRGERLPEGKINPASGKSIPPLTINSHWTKTDWMNLEWDELQPLTSKQAASEPVIPGVYKIIDGGNGQLLYIGETTKLRDRLVAHSRKSWGTRTPLYSKCRQPSNTLDFHLLELENDLLGGYFDMTQDIPKFQFTNH